MLVVVLLVVVVVVVVLLVVELGVLLGVVFGGCSHMEKSTLMIGAPAKTSGIT